MTPEKFKRIFRWWNWSRFYIGSMTLMQTYLILSHNPEFIDNQINLLKSKYQISPFDIYNVIPEKSLGIDDVRRTEKNSRIKPGYGNKKLVLIRDFHLATIEAQNAMLKFLEEPTPSTVIILTAVNDQKILATVLSRCFVIKEIKAETAVPDGKKLEKKILEILNMSSGERLVFSQKLISASNRNIYGCNPLSVGYERNNHSQSSGRSCSFHTRVAVCWYMQ